MSALEDAILQRVAVDDLQKWTRYKNISRIEIFSGPFGRAARPGIQRISRGIRRKRLIDLVMRCWDTAPTRSYSLGVKMDICTPAMRNVYFAVRTLATPWRGSAMCHFYRKTPGFLLYLGGSVVALPEDIPVFDSLDDVWDYLMQIA